MDDKLSLPNYGGQAVIEGVMMRGKNAVAIAMRAPNQEIVVHQEALGAIYKSRLTRIPFLRGLVMLWDALGLGMRALTISANTQTGEEEKLEGPALYGTLIVSLVFAVSLFFLAPAAVGQLSEKVIGLFGAGPAAAATVGGSLQSASSTWAAWFGNLVEGITRLALLIGYIAAVGKIPDIRRVFGYHGAEHKTINAFEAGEELTPEKVARYSVQHPRCGTAFLLTLVLLSVLVFALMGPMPLAWRMISRIAALPLLAGIAYEYIRWTARHQNNTFVRLLLKPNLALQLLTTREPSLDMLEVSIAAFNCMKEKDREITL